VASVRAEGVAEALFELKRLDKLATYSQVAARAGFKPGVGGRTLMTCLQAVQRDWPHLHWWRAIPDDGLLLKESDHAKLLSSGGFEVSVADANKDMVTVVTMEECLFKWEPQAVA
jgi:alkylated DNA nucleotide flippase Atl1